MHAESLYCDAGMELNFHGQTQLVCRAGMLNGEALGLPLWLERPWHPYRTATQLIEADRLSNPQMAPDTERLRGGIERDRFGAPLAYWIRRIHPSDLVACWLAYGAGEWERIPARTDWGRPRVLHVHTKERTGQSRGVPLFAPIMTRLHMLDQQERAELQATIVNSMIAAFVETPLDAEGIASLFGDDYDKYIAGRTAWQVTLKSGAVIPLYPGDKLNPFTPARPNPNQGGFVENCVRHLSVGVNLPYELVYKDFSKTNYSSARAALLEAWRTFTTRRAWLGATWAQPWYEMWLEEDSNAGHTEAPDFYAQRWA